MPLFSSKKDKELKKVPSSKSDESLPGAASSDTLRLRKQDEAGKGLWQQAWEELESKLGDKLPPEFQHLQAWTTKSQVGYVKDEAERRRNDQLNNERKIHGGKRTYREVCDKVSNCAQKFQIIGDLVAQAEPVYAALPWACLRFFIGCAVGESETYSLMLETTEDITEFITQYPVIEQTYAKVDSELSTSLRKSLLKLYKLILEFQVEAIRYLDPNHKFSRVLAGFNPLKAEGWKQQQAAIFKAKRRVDDDIALVDADITKIGIDNIEAGQTDQAAQLEDVKKTLKTLSGDSESLLGGIDARQRQRDEVLIGMWKGPLDDLKAKLEQEETERQKENLLEVRKWLSDAEPETNYMEAKAKRDLPLGSWLVKHPMFQAWESSDVSSLLWLHGFAGTGKTGFVCRVLQHLKDRLEAAEMSGPEPGRLAFFLCSSDKASTGREETSRADPEAALRSIASQLSTSQQGRRVVKIVQEKFDTLGPHSDRKRKLNYTDCVEIIVSISKQVPITIVLDAFDECDQAKSPELVKHLKQIIDLSPRNVKIFISTRPFPAIEDDIKPDNSIEVTKENNGDDVRTFIEETLAARIHQGDLLEGHVSDDLRAEMANTLIARAQNMFLYASLLLNQLCDKNNTHDEDQIRKKLKELPKNLTDVYRGVMEEIHDDKNNSERSCRIAQDTIRWLLHAQETLSYDTLLEAISPPERKADQNEVKKACRNLVVPGSASFEFAHYSVREHARQIPAYSPSQCHLAAAKSCLRILNTTFGGDASREDLTESQRSFEQYALLYWPLHYEGINPTDREEHRTVINAMLRTFLLQGRNKNSKYERWFKEAHERVKPLKNDHDLVLKFNALRASPLTPLFAACVFGLEDLIGKFGRELHGLNKHNEHGQTALCLAIENDKLEVVKALLSSRFPADINLLNVKAVQQFEDIKSGKAPGVLLYASPLQCAAANGRIEIAEYLIEKGAHIDLVAGYWGSPLQAAASKGHGRMVELLLKKGAEPNSQGGFLGNALQAAARRGQSHIINILLENKPPALVDTPGGHFGSALVAAVSSGSSDTVYALLEEKADPTLRSGKYGTPLEAAAATGHLNPIAFREIIKDLLETDLDGQAYAKAKSTTPELADLSRKADDFHLLHRAAHGNFPELVEYCLDRGCQIDMITSKGPKYHRRYGDFPDKMTPLAYACAEGHIEVVEVLLRRGSPIERDKDPSAVLWTAAYQGHAKVVDILIEHFKDKHRGERSEERLANFIAQRPHPRAGHPIVFAAVSSGNAETVKVLLDHGAVYKPNWFNASPLLATATFTCPEVTSLLLNYHKEGKTDVDINKRANNGRTALFEACAKKQLQIAEQLLNAGADYTITDNENATVLIAASPHDDFNVVALIVNKAWMDWKGKDPQRFKAFLDAQPKSAKTALIECAERNRLDNIKLLLDHGANYTLTGHAGNTPLHWSARQGFNDVVVALLEKAQEYDGETRSFQNFINQRNRDGRTALWETAATNHFVTLQFLLDNGADYSIPRSCDISTLHAASYNGYRDAVKLLLKIGSKDSDQEKFRRYLNLQNDQGKTALWDAVDTARPLIVQLLLDHGIDYLVPKKENITALHHASYCGRMEIMLKLLKKASQDLDKERFQKFVNYRNNGGKTALWDAVDAQRPAITRQLLDHGADYSIANDKDVTALHHASFKGNVEIAEILLSVGARDSNRKKFLNFLNHRNDGGITALMDAAQSNHAEIIKLLLDHGADWTIGNINGFTALHYCAHRNHIASVKTLIKLIITTAADNPVDPLYVGTTKAVAANSEDLSASTQDSNKHQPSLDGDIEPVERFLNFLNAQSFSNKATALRDAAKQRHTDIVKCLLTYELEYECYDTDGRTPLHYAVLTGDGDLVNIVLTYAFELSGFGRMGWSHDEGGRITGLSEEQEKFVRWLTAKDKQSRNKDGKIVGGETVWDIAKRMGRDDLLEMIESFTYGAVFPSSKQSE